MVALIDPDRWEWSVDAVQVDLGWRLSVGRNGYPGLYPVKITADEGVYILSWGPVRDDGESSFEKAFSSFEEALSFARSASQPIFDGEPLEGFPEDAEDEE